MCADLGPIRLSRAAAASSAVLVVLSPITINNDGGSCGYQGPAWLRAFADLANPPRPTAHALNHLQELQALDDDVEDSYFHLGYCKQIELSSVDRSTSYRILFSLK